MPLNLGPDEADRYLVTHEAPAPHLDFLTAVAFRTAGAALRLGVFEALADGPLPATAVAERTGTDARGIGQLLAALASFGYVVRTADGYTNSELSARWLRRDDPNGYATILSFWHTLLFELWTDLERSVRHGTPSVDFYPWLDRHPDTLREFQAILGRMANWQSDEVISLLPAPPDGGRLLDIGGGHGTYSIGLCRRYPTLRATLLDAAAPLAIGMAAVAEAGLTDRIAPLAGDLGEVDLGTGHDLALLFNIVHGHDADRGVRLLRRVAAALRPGGTVALLEPLSDHSGDPAGADAAFTRAFSLNLFHTQGGQVYSADELSGWLSAAGFTDLRRHKLASSAIDHLLLARTA